MPDDAPDTDAPDTDAASLDTDGPDAAALRRRHGSARRPDRDVAHPRPEAVDDLTVAAVGKISEALEAVEHARGHLYAFHRLSGTADLTLQEGVGKLREVGRTALADLVEELLVGRDVIDGRWTFQLVEAYDDQYWSAFRDVEAHLRRAVGMTPHVYEAEMKQTEQTQGVLND
jgi:hypothetical protein